MSSMDFNLAPKRPKVTITFRICCQQIVPKGETQTQGGQYMTSVSRWLVSGIDLLTSESRSFNRYKRINSRIYIDVYSAETLRSYKIML